MLALGQNPGHPNDHFVLNASRAGEKERQQMGKQLKQSKKSRKILDKRAAILQDRGG